MFVMNALSESMRILSGAAELLARGMQDNLADNMRARAHK
jgi:hypothetical protein